MWTNENRARYDPSKLRYSSELTDSEWAVIAPSIPPAKRGGNERKVFEREIVNGMRFIAFGYKALTLAFTAHSSPDLPSP